MCEDGEMLTGAMIGLYAFWKLSRGLWRCFVDGEFLRLEMSPWSGVADDWEELCESVYSSFLARSKGATVEARL